MKIEDVEELDKQWHEGDFGAADRAIAALRAEAWHPIEKADELGAHSGEIVVLGYGDWGGATEWFSMIREGKWWTSSVDFVNPTHFRFINPPEGA